jgi:hypothetical protein
MDTKWRTTNSKSAPIAITLGNQVTAGPYATDNYNLQNWLALIVHESTHRQDIVDYGPTLFYGGYLGQYFTNLIGRDEDPYYNISSELRGFANENDFDSFFNNSKNSTDFYNILGNTTMSESKKADKLEVLGIERIKIPKLMTLQSKAMGELSKSKGNDKLSKQLNNLINKINKSINDANNRINELSE